MKHVTLEGYTNREIEWLSEMIAEKLADMGYEGVEGFLFSVEVEFEEAEDDWCQACEDGTCPDLSPTEEEEEA
jgi:hypothetical protein